jgi:hypothetical protein
VKDAALCKVGGFLIGFVDIINDILVRILMPEGADIAIVDLNASKGIPIGSVFQLIGQG